MLSFLFPNYQKRLSPKHEAHVREIRRGTIDLAIRSIVFSFFYSVLQWVLQ